MSISTVNLKSGNAILERGTLLVKTKVVYYIEW